MSLVPALSPGPLRVITSLAPSGPFESSPTSPFLVVANGSGTDARLHLAPRGAAGVAFLTSWIPDGADDGSVVHITMLGAHP